MEDNVEKIDMPRLLWTERSNSRSQPNCDSQNNRTELRKEFEFGFLGHYRELYQSTEVLEIRRTQEVCRADKPEDNQCGQLKDSC